VIVDTAALITMTFREPGHLEIITKLAADFGTPTLRRASATGLL
jgi:hypothetical protein